MVAPESIHVTGNTIVDALNMVIQQLNNDAELGGQVKRELLDILKLDYEARPLVLVTAHRRENLGGGIESICEAVADLSELFPGVNFVFPVHLNPVVRELAEKHLSGKENVTLTRPLNYLEFLTLLSRCSLAISDSGGVQEEGVSLNKRILVTREETERAEGVKSGHLTLVGANRKVIVEEASSVLTAFERSEPFSGLENPYGDGSAAARILGVLAAHGK
jgi:UDP-N-acetylglucosamine 2-epimerase (non-hydrolysing)